MIRRVFIYFIFFIVLAGCSKQEGSNGLGTIEGKVFAYHINKNEVLLDSAYLAEKKVYISYGSNTSIDDEIRTSYTGGYKFTGLTPGVYTLSVFSYCRSCPFEKEVKKMEVNLPKSTDAKTLPDFKIYERP